jgi:glycine cleavage system regulatory protein
MTIGKRARSESLVVTLLGTDRPGIVARLAKVAADAGASWQESKMARLAGKFAGVVRLEVPADSLDELERAIAELDAEGLKLTVERGAAQSSRHGISIDLVGLDRPGIVRDVSAALARHRVNIDELDTEVASASMSGEPLFHARIHLLLPRDVNLEALKRDLEAIADELMVDLTLDTKSGE